MRKGAHPVSKENLGEVNRVWLPTPAEPAPPQVPPDRLGIETLMEQVTLQDQFARPGDDEDEEQNFLLAQQEDELWAEENSADEYD